MRLIDADEIIKESFTVKTQEYGMIDVVAVDIIEEQPIADVQPVLHGYWININSCGIKERKCSNCGKKDNPKTAIKGHYCWNCGAKMGGDTNDT